MQPARPQVTAVILNYRRPGETIDCVRSLERCGYAALKIVIVDNGSGDRSEEILRETFPEHAVLQTGSNKGFAAGNNAGLRHALDSDPGYVLVLNNDTVVSPGFLEPMVEVLERSPTAAAATGTIYFYDDPERVWYAGGRIIPWRASGFSDQLRRRRRPEDLGPTRPVTFASGCMMLFRPAFLRETGGFDERYFMYVEDVHLCARLARAHHELLYVPAATIRHKVETHDLRPYALYYMVRNRLLFLSEWPHSMQRWIGFAYVYVTMGAKAVIWSVSRSSLSTAVWQGVADYRAGRFYQGRGLSLL
jgi:hypothetical protein